MNGDVARTEPKPGSPTARSGLSLRESVRLAGLHRSHDGAPDELVQLGFEVALRHPAPAVAQAEMPEAEERLRMWLEDEVDRQPRLWARRCLRYKPALAGRRAYT